MKTDGNGSLESVQRWTANKRTALVLSILKGETSVQEAARQHGLKGPRRRRLEGAIRGGHRERTALEPRDEEGMKDEQNKAARAHPGQELHVILDNSSTHRRWADAGTGHSLRFGLATSAARAGVPDRVIAQQTGHRSMKVLGALHSRGQAV